MSKLVLKSLSILLGGFFIFLGVLKISPKISRELHKDLRGEFTKYAKAFPLAKTLGWKISSKWYRRTVGGLEIVCGLVMLCIPSGFLKRFANLVLFITKLINAYSHWAIGDAYERTAPTLVFLLLLGCRLLIDWQMIGKSDVDEPNELTVANTKDTKPSGIASENSKKDD